MATKHHNQMTLGEIIDALERLPPDMRVRYDFFFGYFVPTIVGSYRGFYEDLAIGYKEPDYGEHRPTVGDVLNMLRRANGSTMTGYKGGEFRMGRDTALWSANYGDATSTAIVGVYHESHDGEPIGDVILRTVYVP